ncbi:20606_t:CDS:2 [Cetraspora pellucida]|uniref:20606_t:CDS:1 n=1 Tax=Cetraspora pellucida TaxID=1433469 RepID=A0A9N8ZPM3_9GLOM|nr:20606_t:CDS:2 [Cetraspora pellucida]
MKKYSNNILIRKDKQNYFEKWQIFRGWNYGCKHSRYAQEALIHVNKYHFKLYKILIRDYVNTLYRGSKTKYNDKSPKFKIFTIRNFIVVLHNIMHTHEYFNRRHSEWSIIGFLNESDEESFQLKIGVYLKNLKNIINHEQGARRDKAQLLYDNYKKANKSFFIGNVGWE